MFPTSLQAPYASRSRRRGRNDPNSRDYICPCGKSYLSYPALFTHIKIKHNGRAPGQIIKPKSENPNRRGRTKTKQVYDSDSDTQDIAGNCIDRICDYVTEFEPLQSFQLKDLYTATPLYEHYVNYNPQQVEPKYNQTDDIYDQTCFNVFCQVMAEINKRINEPFYIDLMFMFFMIVSKAIEDGDEDTKNKLVRELISYPNTLIQNSIPCSVKTLSIEHIPLFKPQNCLKLVHLFYDWLTQKKYLAFKIKFNENYLHIDDPNRPLKPIQEKDQQIQMRVQNKQAYKYSNSLQNIHIENTQNKEEKVGENQQINKNQIPSESNNPDINQ